VREMSFYETPDYSKVEVKYTPEMIELGIPPPEKWKGLELARTVGSKGWTYENLKEDSEKLIGFEVWENGIGTKFTPYSLFDEYTTRELLFAHGESNPLYTNPEYAKNTKYGCMLTYPTLLQRVRYGMTHGVNSWGPWPVATLVSGLTYELYDVVRANSRFRSSMKVSNIFEKKGRTGRLLFLITQTSFWDQGNRLVAGGSGTYIDVGKTGEEAKKAEEASKRGAGMSETMLYDRQTSFYPEQEVKKIVEDIKAEQRRGAAPRYWEDVEVGDKLVPVVKGPFRVHEVGLPYWDHTPGYVAFRHRVRARPTANPVTGWPYDGSHHHDFNLCNQRGMPGPFDHGAQRMTMVSAPLSNWMGDDGFIRKLSMQVRKPCYYGDVLWYTGEVVNKFKDNVEGIDYGAVDVIISVLNQVGENTLPSKATIYLPSRELGDVKLPIPLPPKEDWKLVTQRDVKDFLKEMESGETIFPPLNTFIGRGEE